MLNGAGAIVGVGNEVLGQQTDTYKAPVAGRLGASSTTGVTGRVGTRPTLSEGSVEKRRHLSASNGLGWAELVVERRVAAESYPGRRQFVDVSLEW